MKRKLLGSLALLLALGTTASAQLQQTPPPWAVPIKQGDALIVDITSIAPSTSTVYLVCYRQITLGGERREGNSNGSGTPNSPNCYNHTAGASGPSYSKAFLGEGWLMSVTITAPNSPVKQYGEDTIQAYVGRGATQNPIASQQLFTCLSSANYTCAWPFPAKHPIEVPGMLQRIAVSNPAAGSNFTTTLNGQQRFIIYNIRFQLAAVGGTTRQVCVKFTDAAGNLVLRKCVQGTQAAGNTNQYDFSVGVGPSFTGAATLTAIPTADEIQDSLPIGLQFNDATVIASDIIGIQVGDTITSVVILAEVKHEND